MYEYHAKCTRVVDGDTADFEVDLGFGVMKKDRFRFAGIDTPEVRGEERPEGLVSKAFVVEAILNKWVIVRTDKDKKGKYGRYIATILYLPEGQEGDGYITLNAELVEKGLARQAEY